MKFTKNENLTLMKIAEESFKVNRNLLKMTANEASIAVHSVFRCFGY